jgi:hypothetical protein
MDLFRKTASTPYQTRVKVSTAFNLRNNESGQLDAKKYYRYQFRGDKSAIRDILNEWALLPDAPKMVRYRHDRRILRRVKFYGDWIRPFACYFAIFFKTNSSNLVITGNRKYVTADKHSAG